MTRKLPPLLLVIVLLGLALWHGPGLLGETDAPSAGSATAAEAGPGSPSQVGRRAEEVRDRADEAAAGIGFRSERALDEHYEKHGREFGAITKDEYLRRAQALRDADVGGSVLEIVRADGAHTRFDTRSGAFVAFDRDLVLRTFFKPNDGRRYFERQAEKEHE